jgi:opacity protein-like surface antigen
MLRKKFVLCAVALASSATCVSTVYAQNEMPTNVATNQPEQAMGPPPVRDWMASPGLQFGLRSGVIEGTGVVYSGLSLRSASSAAIPIIADLGARIIPQLYLGVYGQFAPVITKNTPQCPDGFDCAAQNWRFGIQADYHFIPTSRFDPYVGIGSGYEILHSSSVGTAPIPTPAGVVQGNVNGHAVDRGWEFAAVTVGFDYRAANFFGFGPFFTATLAEYNVRTGATQVSVGGAEVSSSFLAPVSHGIHELFFLGLRGTFNPL